MIEPPLCAWSIGFARGVGLVGDRPLGVGPVGVGEAERARWLLGHVRGVITAVVDSVFLSLNHSVQ